MPGSKSLGSTSSNELFCREPPSFGAESLPLMPVLIVYFFFIPYPLVRLSVVLRGLPPTEGVDRDYSMYQALAALILPFLTSNQNFILVEYA